eukprot:5795_1
MSSYTFLLLDYFCNMLTIQTIKILLVFSNVYRTVTILTSDPNYQGHLWCGGKVSGKTSLSEQQHYYSFIIDPTNDWNISSCGSYIYNYLSIYDSSGTQKGGTNGGGCSPNSAGLKSASWNNIYTPFPDGMNFISIEDWDSDIDSFYVLSLECTNNILPDLYYKNTNISRENVTIIECSKTAPIDTTVVLNVYEFYLTATIDVSILSTVSFAVNINNNCWKHTVFMLNEHNNWVLITSPNEYKKGIYRLIIEPVCLNLNEDTEYVAMNCGFNTVNSDISFYEQSAWITVLEDISCGLTVKGYAEDGHAYSYEFVTNSNIGSDTMVSFSTCDTNKAKQNGLSVQQYKYLNYTPYIQDEFGYWEGIKHNSLYANDYKNKDASCNYLELNNILSNTHYIATIAIPYWLHGEYTIYMDCSDNSAINEPLEYQEYISYKSPPTSSVYVKPSKNNVILCDDVKSGTLAYDKLEQFYAFKAKKYQYWIEFDICNDYNDTLQEDQIFDAVLSLYYYTQHYDDSMVQILINENIFGNCGPIHDSDIDIDINDDNVRVCFEGLELHELLNNNWNSR